MFSGTFPVVQWLRLHASTAGGVGSIPGQGTKILHTVQHGQKKKKKGMVVLSVFKGCSVAGSFPGMTYSTIWGALSPEHKSRKRNLRKICCGH